MDELARQSAAVKAGVQKGEAMLANQASVLDALFNSLTRRAMANADAGNVEALDTFMRLAFKAQSQCRTSWEAIAEKIIAMSPQAFTLCERVGDQCYAQSWLVRPVKDA